MARNRYTPRAESSRGFSLNGVWVVVKSIGRIYLYIFLMALPMALCVVGIDEYDIDRLTMTERVTAFGRSFVIFAAMCALKKRAFAFLSKKESRSVQNIYVAKTCYYISMGLVSLFMLPAIIGHGALIDNILGVVRSLFLLLVLVCLAFYYINDKLLNEMLLDSRIDSAFIGIYFHLINAFIGISIMSINFGSQAISFIAFIVGGYYMINRFALVDVMLLARCPKCRALDRAVFDNCTKSSVESSSFARIYRNILSSINSLNTWRQIYRDNYSCSECGARWGRVRSCQISRREGR